MKLPSEIVEKIYSYLPILWCHICRQKFQNPKPHTIEQGFYQCSGDYVMKSYHVCQKCKKMNLNLS